jgi:alpha-L-arabinofuranosidase
VTTATLLLTCLLLVAPGNAPGHLKNPGFETATAVDGWDVITYGAKAEVVVDGHDPHEGRQALRITASDPSDTALGQEITLEGGGWYRFQGWVRTRGLDPMGAPVCGSYQIQRPGGQSVLASGTSLGGDHGWTAVPIVFQAPPDGRVRVAVFFVGYGKGRGTAWFDGLTLEPVDPAQSPAVITREPLRPGRIEPGQYGQFVEYLCDLVPSMWADKLCDGNFEGLSPYKFVYLKETDFRERPWYPTGATNRATFERDAATKVNGDTSYRVATVGDTPCTVGIAQTGLAIEKGVGCRLGIHLKQRGIAGPVRVRLHHEGMEYASCELRPTGEWDKYSARHVPSVTDDRATMTVEFRGPGTLWLDAASLMPEDAVDGWRRDVVEAVRALKPTVIRFGGSTLDDPNLGDFEWHDTVGDPTHRRPFRAWGGLQPTGPGLEEFVRFCRHVNAEPLLCVRSTKRTPEDAAKQVEYFNGATSTPMGALRARNGCPDPYRVRYWQVGNEQGGADYEARLPAFCQAMKRVDPTIKLLSSFPTPGVVDRAGAWLDFVAPHHYGCENLPAMEADLENIRRLLTEHAPGRPIKVAVTEWNTTAGDAGPRRAMLWTLANALACSRYHNLLHRQCDLVTIANRSNLINSFCSGCIQVDNHRLYVTPTYHAQKLYATLAGDRPLRIDSALPSSAAPDLSATLAADGRSVVVFAVNDGLTPLDRTLDLGAFGGAARDVEVWTLTDAKAAGEPDVTNSFAQPERVAPRRSIVQAASPRFAFRFPALSLTVLRWPLPDAKK